MADLFPERLEPATGVSAAERQQSFRDLRDRGQPPRRRPAPPAPPREAELDAETGDSGEESPHQLDRMA